MLKISAIKMIFTCSISFAGPFSSCIGKTAIHSAAMNCAVATATLLYYFVACHCLLAFATATFPSPFTSIFHNDVSQSAKDVPHNTSGHLWLSKWRWKWTQDTPVTANGKQFDENEEESIDEAKITTVGYISMREYDSIF
jgi:hypothetical protein